MRSGLIILLFSLAVTRAWAYKKVPALIHLSEKNQHDTIGFNLVSEIPSLLYKEIIAKKIKLWDSPGKEIEIGPGVLQALEKNTQTSFTKIENLFINELWSSNRKHTEFEIIGFSFINKNSRGEKVSYGFVDASDIHDLLKNNHIPNNANGYYSITFWEALMSRRYDYNLMQFGSNNFRENPGESIKIKNEAFNPKKKLKNRLGLSERKKIDYSIFPEPENENSSTSQIFLAFEGFLKNNMEEFFNLGGGKLRNHLRPGKKINITRIEVSETWNNSGDFINYQVSDVILFVDNTPLDTIPLHILNTYKILINYKSAEDFLKEKNFDFTITGINSQAIKPEESPKYYKGLKFYSWTQLTEFVKFF